MAEQQDVVLVLLDALAGPPLRPELRGIGVEAAFGKPAAEGRLEAAAEVEHGAEQVEGEGANAVKSGHGAGG